MISVVIFTLFGNVLLCSSTIRGGSKLEYFKGKQNPATHLPTAWPFTIPPLTSDDPLDKASGTTQYSKERYSHSFILSRTVFPLLCSAVFTTTIVENQQCSSELSSKVCFFIWGRYVSSINRCGMVRIHVDIGFRCKIFLYIITTYASVIKVFAQILGAV